jgi:adenine-specific DNA-methyltransferase
LATHLAADGYLAFILPTSIFNSAYYQPMRDYIAQVATVCCLESLNRPGFFDTAQETILMILRKRPDPSGAYFVNIGGVRYLSPYYKELCELLAGTTTLRSLDLGVKTGNVVWNQVKENLVSVASANTKLLIYSTNIAGGVLSISGSGTVGTGSEKKQYVKGIDKPTISGPVVLVDRGYGNSYSFNAVRVSQVDFYAENHVNVIYPHTAAATAALDRVMTSFADPRTARFVEMFVGNGGLSATELETVLPIF